MDHVQIQKYYKTGCAFNSRGVLQNSAVIKISDSTLKKLRKDKNDSNNNSISTGNDNPASGGHNTSNN